MTENGGGSGPAGSQLYVGIDVGRHSHLVAAIPRQRMADGSWEHMAPRRFAMSAGGYRELVEWLALSGLGRDQIKIGIEPTGGWYARTVVGWLERHGVADLVTNLALWQCIYGPLDEYDIAGRADAEA